MCSGSLCATNKVLFHCQYIINEYSLVTGVACFSFVLFSILELKIAYSCGVVNFRYHGSSLISAILLRTMFGCDKYNIKPDLVSLAKVRFCQMICRFLTTVEKLFQTIGK